ncbi:MAG: alpha/beta hydrolase [Brevundimonas sp.]|uniref:alpha/beta fold hydrolase n=1 Tax=Brevundimonas sp. TaxID=1871086 RepID=UPI0027372E5C|nr:alpha/beta hydrolase [Brevundimonas sp.]MDP3403294.1 alpha/beta hydrolase [Brevundimonas sp.]
MTTNINRPERRHGLDTLRWTALKAGVLGVSLLASGLAGPVTARSAANENPAEQSPAGPGGYVRPAAPGQLFEVAADRRLHLFCKGENVGPAVIFEAGLSQFTANSTLAAAQNAIAGFARVCTYDRAGMGWSDPAPEGWTYPDRTRDLHALLQTAGVEGPYVLVGHSLGGLLIRAFANAYPDQVVGLVLVDATSERNLPEFEAARDSTVSQIDAALAVSQPGVPVIGMPAGTSAEVQMAFTPEVLRGVKAEFEALALLDAATLPPVAPGVLGDVPLIVVRRGRTMSPPNAADLNHQQGQEDLAALSSNSVLIVAENSGHVIPLDEPQVVADAVRRVLAALNSPERRL